MYEPHPLKADYERAIDQIENAVGELTHSPHRAWAWKNCIEEALRIMRSDPPPSVSLFNEIASAKRLIDQAQRSKRSEYALVEHIRNHLQKARRVCDYPARDYSKD